MIFIGLALFIIISARRSHVVHCIIIFSLLTVIIIIVSHGCCCILACNNLSLSLSLLSSQGLSYLLWGVMMLVEERGVAALREVLLVVVRGRTA